MDQSLKKYNCEKCGFTCKFKSIWEKHLATEKHKTGIRKKRSDIKEPYKCMKCNYETKNIVTYKKHLLNNHANKEKRKKEFKLYCDYCDFGTFSKDTFKRHNKSKKHEITIERNK